MKKILSLFACVAALAFMIATPASAQATRTWISGVGDDANPCSRTAPCKTWAGAIAKTSTGGEIDNLDAGGFGSLTITKSIVLDGAGGIGGAVGSTLTAGTNGIVINCTGCVVKIRNMTINGLGLAGSGTTSLSGISFVSGASLILEHVGIWGFGTTGSTGTYAGVAFTPSTAATLDMSDVETQYNLGDGILIKPGAGGSASVTLNKVRAMKNGGSGLRVDGTNASGTGITNVTAVDSTFVDNNIGISAITNNSLTYTVVLDRVTASNNSTLGIFNNGSTVNTFLGRSVVSGNGTAFAIAAGRINTYGDNTVAGNGNASSPSTPVLPRT